jgi:hypothetical protein
MAAVVRTESASGTPVSAIARLVAAHENTVRDVIHAFNEVGLRALDPKRIAYVHLDDDEAWGPHLHDQSRRHRQHPGHVRPGDRRGTRLAPRLSAIRAGHN